MEATFRRAKLERTDGETLRRATEGAVRHIQRELERVHPDDPATIRLETKVEGQWARLQVVGRTGGVLLRTLHAYTLEAPHFHRRWLERPNLDSTTWFHGLIVIVAGNAIQRVAHPHARLLVANWPHAALAIVPVRVSPLGELLPEGDDEKALPDEDLHYENLIERAVQHLCGWLEVFDGRLRICGIDVPVEPEQYRLVHALAIHAQTDEGFLPRKQLPGLIERGVLVEPKAVDKRVQRLSKALSDVGYGHVLDSKPRRGVRLRWARSLIRTTK